MSENEENIRVGWIRVGEYGGGCGGVLWGGTVGRYVGGYEIRNVSLFGDFIRSTTLANTII